MYGKHYLPVPATNVSLPVFAEEPVFVEGQSPVNLNCTEGDTISIRCNADAEPEAEVTWLRNGEPLNCE